jgi:hypothetical protein
MSRVLWLILRNRLRSSLGAAELVADILSSSSPEASVSEPIIRDLDFGRASSVVFDFGTSTCTCSPVALHGVPSIRHRWHPAGESTSHRDLRFLHASQATGHLVLFRLRLTAPPDEAWGSDLSRARGRRSIRLQLARRAVKAGVERYND